MKTTVKSLGIAALTIMLVFTLAGCGGGGGDDGGGNPNNGGHPNPGTPDTVSVTGVSLKASTSLVVGGTETLIAEISPSNATNKNVTWSSSNTDVATVSANGVVTGVSAGTALVIVATKDGGYQAMCNVTVSNFAISVTGVSLKASTNLFIGDIENLIAVITPENATNQNVTWSSSNSAVATVSANGTITAVSEGTATVTVTTVDGGHKANCAVTISPIAVTGVSLNKPSTYIVKGDTETLYAIIEPENATNQNVTWSSNNTAVATVSANGEVSAVSAGTATITVTTVDGGHQDTCAVTVSNFAVSVTGVSLKTSTSLVVGETEHLIPTITPENATHQKITWHSNNTAVAVVSESGVVTAEKVGTATITVTTDDGGKTASCTVTVNPKVITFTVDAIQAQTYTGNIIQPVVTVKDGSKTLTLTTDYTVSYANNTNAGTATVTISGAGNYAGSSGSGTFTINPKIITFTVDTIPAQTYTGSAIQPVVTVKDGSTTLTVNTDYTAVFVNNVNPGIATVILTGAGNYAGSSGSGTFTINPKVITFTVDAIPAQTYTGSAIQPVVTVKDGSTTLTLNTDYTVSYANNTNVGTATVNISGAGNYAGSSGSVTFTINKATPTAYDFTISGLTQTWDSSAKTVTITPKPGKSNGTITVKYNGSTTAPSAADTYTVTFDVAAAGNFNAASGLSAGTLTIEKATPTAADFTISGTGTFTYDGSTKTVTVTPKTGKSNGTITVKYNGNTTAPSAVGTYTITFDVAEGTNFNAVSGLSAGTLKITHVPIEMISIPAGTFTMGSPTSEEGSSSNERPQHSVTLSAFSMGKYEVTQEQWVAVMGSNPSWFTTAVEGESGTPSKLPVEV